MTFTPDPEELKRICDSSDLFPLSVEISESLPSLSDIPKEAQMILTLVAFGWSYRSIGGLLECTAQTIQYYITRYDPERQFSISKEGRRKFLAKLWEARCGEALMSITTEQLNHETAQRLADIAFKCAKAGEMLDPSTSRGTQETDVQRFMKELDVG